MFRSGTIMYEICVKIIMPYSSSAKCQESTMVMLSFHVWEGYCSFCLCFILLVLLFSRSNFGFANARSFFFFLLGKQNIIAADLSTIHAANLLFYYIPQVLCWIQV